MSCVNQASNPYSIRLYLLISELINGAICLYAKLINPKAHGKVMYDNTSSAARLMNYLAQEKKG
ncbi:hypothetical protein GCM10011378_40450 [Hymenobacter glacieicola]|uniref:Uncharacterized protein n=1 Tax=Hymenobacter glacieicola TaxID=1562124 RepID=A0ABQ1X8C0_9BACT|nr:hypothetical protein GCM10011378_40450 [Hymenobacter glacieicola]